MGLGGNVGSPTAPSSARATRTTLVEMGRSPSRHAARGYDPNYPLAANPAPAGRAMNRRLSLRVLAK